MNRKQKDNKIIVDLMRHGEPVGGRRYRGNIDDPLSELGWSQMRQAVGDQHVWHKVITSPLTRCRAFAEEVADQRAVPLVVEDRFEEIGFGDWEGKSPDELRVMDPEQLTLFYHDPINHGPPGAESAFDFMRRIETAWLALLESVSGQHVLIVAHAGVIRCILAYVLGMPTENMFRIQVDNASISRICITEERPATVVFQNGQL